ncbi:MAG: VWA domain-containing protein [Gemmatimonadales bacterium]|nr:VWA domain-containing protein [Gemmatimonadales bacterium]
MRFSNLGLFITLVLGLALFGCDSSTEPEPGSETSDEFYLTKFYVETQDPAYVNILFQVADGNGLGVDGLVSSDFLVKEDDSTVSPTESRMRVKKMDAIPFTTQTVLMLDISPSVHDQFEKIREAALLMVDGMHEKQEIAVYTFSSNINRLVDFTDFQKKDEIVEAINAIEIQQGSFSTNLYGAVIEGLSQWRDTYSLQKINQGYLVIITDGSDEASNYSLDQALNAQGLKWIYTIGLGNEIEEPILAQLGNKGFYHVTDISKLSSVFVEVQEDIAKTANSFYWLYYLSGLRDSDQHELSLEVLDNKNKLEDCQITHTFSSSRFFDLAAGLWVNYSENAQTSLTETDLLMGEGLMLNAVSHWGDNDPDIVWSSQPSGMLTIEVDPSGMSAYILPGTTAGNVTLTVEDRANIEQNSSFSTSIDITIIYRDFETIVFDFDDGLYPDGFNPLGDNEITSDQTQSGYCLYFDSGDYESLGGVRAQIDLPATNGFTLESDIYFVDPLVAWIDTPGGRAGISEYDVSGEWVHYVYKNVSVLSSGLYTFEFGALSYDNRARGYVDNIRITCFPQ